MAERVVAVSLIARINSYLSDMDQVKKKNREIGDSADQAAERFEKQNQAMERVGGTLLLGGAIATAATALAVKAAIDWESAWAGVTKTVDGTPAQLAEVEQGLRDLTSELPATHEELAAVAEAAGQLGVAREDIIDFTRTMVMLAETTNLTSDEAATSIAQLMNVMKTAPDDVDNLGAALVALGNDGASTERDIIQMAQRIAGAGATIGLSEAEVMGFANALASVGIEAEAGGSAISRIMTDIAMSVSAGGDELSRFASVAGLSADEFAAKFRAAPADAIATFIEGLGRVNASGGDVFKTLTDLGQTDIRVSQALLGMANSGDLLRESLDLGAEAWEENTALVAEAEKRFQTTEAQLQILGNRVNDAAIDFGSVFLPAINGAAQALGDFASFLGGLPDEVQGAVAVAVGLGGAIAVAGGAALIAVPKIAELKLAMQTLGISGGGAAKGIGLMSGALAVAGLVLAVWATETAEAAAKTQGFVTTIDEATGRITKGTRDMVKENLAAADSFLWMQQDSVYTAAEKIGLSLDTVTDAAMGNVGALRQVEAATLEAAKVSLEHGNAAKIVADGVKGEASSIAEAIKQVEQKNSVTEEGVPITKSAAEAYLEAAEGAGELSSQLDQLIEQISEANGIGQDAISSNIDYQNSLADIDEVIRKATEGLDENKDGVADYILTLDQSTQAGRDNMSMLVGMAQDAEKAAAAQFKLDGDTAKYKATLEGSRQALIDRATQLGLNADEASRLADDILRIPPETAWKVVAQTADARARLDSLLNDYSNRTISVQTLIKNMDRDIPQANGGMHAYANGGFGRAFAGGGMANGIYSGGRPMYKFAEYETGWEGFVSGKRGRERENLGYAVESIRRLGHQNPAAARDVLGGSRPPINVTIHAAPQMDVNALASKVVRRVEEKLK